MSEIILKVVNKILIDLPNLVSTIFTFIVSLISGSENALIHEMSNNSEIECIALDSEDSDFEVICDIKSKLRERASQSNSIAKDVKTAKRNLRSPANKGKRQKPTTSKKTTRSQNKRGNDNTIKKRTISESSNSVNIAKLESEDVPDIVEDLLSYDALEDEEEIVEIANLFQRENETINEPNQSSLNLTSFKKEENFLTELTQQIGILTKDSERLEEPENDEDIEFIGSKINEDSNESKSYFSLFSSPNKEANLLQKVGKEAWKGLMNLMQKGQKEASKGQKRNGNNLYSIPKKIKLTDYFIKKPNSNNTLLAMNEASSPCKNEEKMANLNPKLNAISTEQTTPFPIFNRNIADPKIPRIFSNASILKKNLSELYGKGEVVALNIPGRGINCNSNGNEDIRKRSCPFYKKLPNTNFSVDAFSYGDIPGIKAYFLSHFHYDHYGGLKKTFNNVLLCSKPTANLVKLKIGVKSEHIRELELNKVYNIDNVEVVLIDANHCPGSVMFIFRLPNGINYLHTGDFRYTTDMLENEFLAGLRIDCLYLDTTYCDPKYNFPRQIDAINQVITQVKTLIAFRPKTLIVCGSYSIGKERVFINLAHSISTKVFCKTDKKRIIEVLEIPEFTSTITANENISSIHVLPMNNLNPTFLSEYLSKRTNLYTNIVAIKPTGWEFSSAGNGFSKKSFLNDSITILGVPYSEHSSFSELSEFVRLLRPLKVQPTVNVGDPKKREMMMNYIDKWMKS